MSYGQIHIKIVCYKTAISSAALGMSLDALCAPHNTCLNVACLQFMSLLVLVWPLA